MTTLPSRRRPVPDPLPLARMRALRLVAVPWAEEELALLQETAATAGRRLIDVAGDHGARALMLGWPADVDPMAVLGADPFLPAPATGGRRLIDVAGDHGARALMLGWPADVDPMAVLGADGEDLPGATPTTC